MLQNISRQFRNIAEQIKGKGAITAEHIAQITDQVRTALLEADVALEVVDEFCEKISHSTINRQIDKSVNPSQVFMEAAHQELCAMMGGKPEKMALRSYPAVVLACGLQGAGKTTSLVKLAKYLRDKLKKRSLLLGLDVQRPAAIEQLEQLCHENSLACHHSDSMQINDRLQEALVVARKQIFDVLLLDTAGRLAIDEQMMKQLLSISKLAKPNETMLFIDAMYGQDAINVAKAFAAQMPIDSLFLTKMDGDAKGGAVLSAKHAVGSPIKFIGTGEKISDIDVFYPDRMASRILGMGDLQSLVESANDLGQQKQAQQLLAKLKKPKAQFDLQDYSKQMDQALSMGGLEGMLDKLPGAFADKLSGANVDNKLILRQKSIILSMTKQERTDPDLIKASRKRRIAAGSGVQVADVNRLLKQYEQVAGMMKKFSTNPLSAMRAMKGLLG